MKTDYHKNVIVVRLAVVLLFLNVKLISSQFANDDHTQTPLNPEEDESYLRIVFENGTEQYFRHWECPDGIWAEDYFQMNPVKCLCVKGAFLLSKSLCDEEFEILTGNEHCYDLANAMIRRFTPLTGQKGLGGRASTVFRSDAPYVARLISNTPITTVNEPVQYVFRLNDPFEFSSYALLKDGSAARLGCLEAQKVGKNLTKDPIMQVAQLPDCANDFRGPQPWCKDSLGKYVTTIKVGSKWGPKSTGTGTQYPGSCAKVGGGGGHNKPPNPPKGRKRRAVPAAGRSAKGTGSKSSLSAKNSYKAPPKCNEFEESKMEKAIQGSPSVEHFVDRNEYPKRTFHTSSLHQQEVNEQTAKIARSLLDIHLGTLNQKVDSSHKLAAAEKVSAYRYVQIARQIMEKVCPNEYIDPFVLKFFTRIFRLIYLDLAEKYPYPEVLVDNSTLNQNILGALTECHTNSPNITFLTNETCHNAGFYGTNISETILLYPTNLSIPHYVKFNASSMDFPLETVWKMMMLVHYFCASNFSDSPVSHSEFVVKYEAFLRNPALLYRWYHPGASNEVFKLFLSAYNLRDFAKSVDMCIATAAAVSPYKGWLRRPAEVLKWKARFSGPTVNATNIMSNTKPVKNGRRKRSSFYFQNNFWDDQAYCMSNSKSIVSEVQTSTGGACKKKPAWFQNTD